MLVGREAELGRLDAALDRALEGRGSAVLVSGPAGSGKTALIEAAAERARGRGFQVCAGRAWPSDAGLAYAPILEALGPALRARDRTSRARLIRGLDALRLIFPDLDLPEPTPVGDTALERTRLFESLARLLDRLAAEDPLLLLVDDLHATDAATVDLLAYAIRRLLNARAVVILAYRTPGDGMQRALQRLGTTLERNERGEVLEPSPLDRQELATLAADLLGDPPGPDLLSLLEARTRGAPLFAVALLRMLRDSQGIMNAGGRWHLIASPSALPPEVEGVFRDSLDALSPAPRHLLERLAVAGDPVSWPALSRLVTATEVQQSLDALVETGWLVECATTVPTWHVWHPLAQEVVTASLSALRVRRLHRDWLDALEGDGSVPLARLARHYRGAGSEVADAVRASEVLRRAAAEASAGHAYDDAARWLAAALTHARDGVAAEVIPDLLRDLGRAWAEVGERVAALEAWREARDALRTVGRVEEAAALRAHIALALWDIGQLDLAVGEVERGLATIADGRPTRALARLVEVSTRLHNRRGELAQVRRVAHRLADLTDFPESLRLDVEFARFMALLADRDIVAGMDAIERAADAACTPAEQLRVYKILVPTAVNIGYPRRLEVLQEVDALGVSLGAGGVLLDPTLFRGSCLLTDGDHRRAGPLLVDAVIQAERAGPPRRLAMAMGCLAIARSALARPSEAQDWLDRARAIHGGKDADRHTSDVLHLADLVMRISRSDWVGAAAVADEMRTDEIAPPPVFRAHRAAAYRRVGRPDDAMALADLIDAASGGYPGPRAHALHIRACIASDQGEPGAGERLLEAAALFEHAGMAGWAGLARLAFAETENGERAVDQARTAYDTLERHGWLSMRDRARAALRRLGARVPGRQRDKPNGPLSPRQMEVAQLAAKGLTGPEIGRALFISPHTASTHIKKIYARLQVSSRAELTSWMITHGHADGLDVP